MKNRVMELSFQASRKGGRGTIAFISSNLKLARLSLVKQWFLKEFKDTCHWPRVASLALTLVNDPFKSGDCTETCIVLFLCCRCLEKFCFQGYKAIPCTVCISFLKLAFLTFIKEGSYLVSSNRTFKVRRPLLLSEKSCSKELHRVDYIEWNALL